MSDPNPPPRGGVGCLGRLFGLGGRTETPQAGPPPFEAKQRLLSKAERSFLGVLEQAVGGEGEYRVFVKVRVLDVLDFKKGSPGGGGKGTTTWRNKVDRQHLDFLLVTPDELRPVAAVELDDKSHAGERAAQRDATKDAALAAAGLPLVRIEAKRGYSVESVRSAIRAAIASR